MATIKIAILALIIMIVSIEAAPEPGVEVAPTPSRDGIEGRRSAKAATARSSRGAPVQHRSVSPLTNQQLASAQERLYQRIISNEQLTRPDLTDIPINVTVRVILIKLQDLIEKSELMETTVRIQIGWRDKRLAWDKNDYGQITEILLPSSSVWIPDLAVINSVSDVYSVVRDTRFEIKVENDGQLWWHPTGVLKTFCKLQLSYFPFDRQKCSIIVESPTFDRRFLNLKLRSERTPVDLRMYVDSETWRLEKTFGTSQNLKVGVNTYFSRIEFWLIIERARLYHSINFIMPCFVLSAIQTVFFFLPATHPQRVGSTTVTMLSVMVFQSMVVAQLPKTSESVPLLSIYIDLVILVSATSVCASIFTALCNFNNDRRAKVPSWLRNCCVCHREPPKQPPPPNNSYNRGTPTRSVIAKNNSPFGESLLGDHHQNQQLTTAVNAHNKQNQGRLRGIREEAISPRTVTNLAKLAAERDDRLRRRSMNSDIGYTVVSIPEPSVSNNVRPSVLPVACCPEDMTVFSAVIDDEPDGNKIDQGISWLDVLMCINYVLGTICALAISVGPAIIFGVIPAVVDHQDFPSPIGENFTLLTNSQVEM